ncbi:MAG: hypothetical protein ACI4XM_03920 [Candidatus Coprovivens sp.]
MKTIKVDETEEFFPNIIDYEEAKQKGLADESTINEKYLQIQSLYYYYLNNYLSRVLHLEEFEQYLLNMNRNHPLVSEEEKDIYQKLSSNNFFYVRNTLYIEQLTLEEINNLLSAHEKQDIKTINQIIETTYKKVLTIPNQKEIYETNYGPLSSIYFAPIDSLIIGLRFGIENESKYPNSDEWFKDYCKRREIIEGMKSRLLKEWNNNLDIDCRLIEYDENSIKKKTNLSL